VKLAPFNEISPRSPFAPDNCFLSARQLWMTIFGQ